MSSLTFFCLTTIALYLGFPISVAENLKTQWQLRTLTAFQRPGQATMLQFQFDPQVCFINIDRIMIDIYVCLKVTWCKSATEICISTISFYSYKFPLYDGRWINQYLIANNISRITVKRTETETMPAFFSCEINTLRHSTDDIFKCILLNETFWIVN